MPADPRLLAAVFAGGFAGTLARLAAVEALPPEPGHWPWATLCVNVAGAFLLGLVTARRPAAVPHLTALLGAGVCGALTTFSALQLELLEMLDAGRPLLACAYVAVSLAAGLAGVRVGEGVR